MKALTSIVAKFLFSIPFGIFGILHIMNADAMKELVPLPPDSLKIFWIYLTGVALIAACISIIINKKAKLASLLLGIMLIVFVLTIYLPGVMSGDQMAMGNLLKDTSLAGAAFTYAGLSKN